MPHLPTTRGRIEQSRQMETETLAMAQEIDFSFFALFARATFTNKLVISS
jgi:hypothetical protein